MHVYVLIITLTLDVLNELVLKEVFRIGMQAQMISRLLFM